MMAFSLVGALARLLRRGSVVPALCRKCASMLIVWEGLAFTIVVADAEPH